VGVNSFYLIASIIVLDDCNELSIASKYFLNFYKLVRLHSSNIYILFF
jgi:hypothetical protein